MISCFTSGFTLLITGDRQGATVEQMTIEVNRAKARLDAAEHDWKQMAALNKV